MTLNSVAVFCGSTLGTDPAFADSARLTGRTLAERGIDLIYGGGHSGLMGVVADAALEAGGRVIGVIPTNLVERELAHPRLTELHEVSSMHERKAVMADLADAFIALPGGAGTLEEIAEQWTWAQLTIHSKPCGFLDVGGFWSPMQGMLDSMVAAGFVRQEQSGIVTITADLDALLATLEAPQAWPDKWGNPLDIPRP